MIEMSNLILHENNKEKKYRAEVAHRMLNVKLHMQTVTLKTIKLSLLKLFQFPFQKGLFE